MNKFFNAIHAPSGAYSSFTLGHKKNHGGFGIMLGKPANQDIYIGYGDGEDYKLLPFYEENNFENIDNFTEDPVFSKSRVNISQFKDEEINRNFNVGTDEFIAKNMKFKIYTPHFEVPEKIENNFDKLCIAPSLIANITLDNPTDKQMKIIFGMKRNNKSSSLRHGNKKYPSIIDGLETSISTSDRETISTVHFTVNDALNEDFMQNEFNREFMLGECGLLVTTVEPNSSKSIDYAISFFKDGTITSGIQSKFLYTEYWKKIEEIGQFALDNKKDIIKHANKQDSWLDKQELDIDEKFQLAHAIKSYYGFTQLLIDENKQVRHLVNEGEYQMMQTFDLMIDHLFWELYKNPWVVRNNLEFFISHFKYKNNVLFNGEEYSAGISFTHDMGNINQFSLNGRSSYELQNISGCFSHMTYEQLTNFIIVFMTYTIKTGDKEFAEKYEAIIEQCLEGLLVCDHPVSEYRNGIMSFDSIRVGSGYEITTYDSLDESLGQARENSYLISKTYASYCLLKEYYEKVIYDDLAINTIDNQLKLLVNTIEKYEVNDVLPAILDEKNTAKIIPVAEGLAYLKYLGLDQYIYSNNPYEKYITLLKKHTINVLNDRTCLFPNGAYKLSSTSNMTWLSKIYLSEYVHINIFDIDRSLIIKANKEHAKWLFDPKLSYWAWSDQILNHKIKGSKYYPRGVTAFLWTLNS